jgi:hypothetical protein
MRAFEFLIEDAREVATQNLAQVILRDCKPYLQMMNYGAVTSTNWGKTFTWLYRGMEAAYATSRPWENYIEPISVRTDRRPRDTNQILHQIIDDWQAENLGFRGRTAGLFVSGSMSTSGDYGLPYVVFPIGQFNYYWAERVRDMATSAGECAGSAWKTPDPELIPEITQEIQNMLAKAEWHKNEGMQLYLNTYRRNEMVLDCKQFYIVPSDPTPGAMDIRDLMPYLQQPQEMAAV